MSLKYQFQPTGWVHPKFAATDFPNEPDGYSLVAEYHGSTIPNGHFGAKKCDSCNGFSDCEADAEIAKGCIQSDGNQDTPTLVTDATHPIDGEGDVTRMTFLQGTTLGGAPNFINMWGPNAGVLTDWAASRARPDGFELEEMYYSLRVKLVSGPDDGTWDYYDFLKMPGYFGHGSGTGNAFGNSTFGFISHPNGDGIHSGGFNLKFEQQGPGSVDDADQLENVGTSSATDVVDVGVWYHFEILTTLNDIGSANGTFTCYVNGTKEIEVTGVTWRTATHPRGFYTTHWNPVLGGTDDTKARDDHIHIGHRRVSGIELAGVN